MIYLVAAAGLVAGFMMGLIVLRALLRDRSAEELRNDRGLRWRYGTLCWMIAFASAYAFIVVYQRYFLG